MPITTDVVSSNLDQGEAYNIMAIKTNIYKTVNPYNSYPANEYRTETVGPAFLNQDQQVFDLLLNPVIFYGLIV